MGIDMSRYFKKKSPNRNVRPNRQAMQQNHSTEYVMKHPPLNYAAIPGAVPNNQLLKKIDFLKGELIQLNTATSSKDSKLNLELEMSITAMLGFRSHMDTLTQVNTVGLRNRDIHIPMYFDMTTNKFTHGHSSNIDEWKTITLPNGSVIHQTEIMRVPGSLDPRIVKRFTPKDEHDVTMEELMAINRISSEVVNMSEFKVSEGFYKQALMKKMILNNVMRKGKYNEVSMLDVALYRYFKLMYMNQWKTMSINATLTFLDEWVIKYASDMRHDSVKGGYIGMQQPNNSNTTRNGKNTSVNGINLR